MRKILTFLVFVILQLGLVWHPQVVAISTSFDAVGAVGSCASNDLSGGNVGTNQASVDDDGGALSDTPLDIPVGIAKLTPADAASFEAEKVGLVGSDLSEESLVAALDNVEIRGRLLEDAPELEGVNIGVIYDGVVVKILQTDSEGAFEFQTTDLGITDPHLAFIAVVVLESIEAKKGSPPIILRLVNEDPLDLDITWNVQVTNTTGISSRAYPIIGPDDQVFFTGEFTNGESTAAPYKVNVNFYGGETENVVKTPALLVDFQVSNDGSFLVGEGVDSHIYKVEGNESTQLTNIPVANRRFRLSPNDTWLASADSVNGTLFNLVVIPVDGSKEATVINPHLKEKYIEVAWNENNQLIVLVKRPDNVWEARMYDITPIVSGNFSDDTISIDPTILFKMPSLSPEVSKGKPRMRNPQVSPTKPLFIFECMSPQGVYEICDHGLTGTGGFLNFNAARLTNANLLGHVLIASSRFMANGNFILADIFFQSSEDDVESYILFFNRKTGIPLVITKGFHPAPHREEGNFFSYLSFSAKGQVQVTIGNINKYLKFIN